MSLVVEERPVDHIEVAGLLPDTVVGDSRLVVFTPDIPQAAAWPIRSIEIEIKGVCIVM